MSEFPIHRIDRALRSQAVESLGSKPKFWFTQGETRCLFKADDRGTGEDWAEVIASELAALLGLPHVHYELAAEYDGETYVLPGVICETMAPPPDWLVLGNEFLLANDPNYPSAKRYRVKQHTIDAVVEAVTVLQPPAIHWMMNCPLDIQSALDVFVGYVMLDAWIANQDRHHENWGAVWDGKSMRLAPTFDHGAGLARNLMDSERQERLSTRDQARGIPRFAAKALSAMYRSPDDAKAMRLREVFQTFAAMTPTAATAWKARLQRVQESNIENVVAQIPALRMSEVTKVFTLELLRINREHLLA